MMYLYGIGVKTARRAPLLGVNNAIITVEAGIVGDVRGGGRDRSRQVTLISWDQWVEVCRELSLNPYVNSWMLRRAGLCIAGIHFGKQYIGQHMVINREVTLLITGETTPCDTMNTVFPGLKEALSKDGRCGVTATVITGGRIATGNGVVMTS